MDIAASPSDRTGRQEYITERQTDNSLQAGKSENNDSTRNTEATKKNEERTTTQENKPRKLEDSNAPVMPGVSTLKKGLLWQQRDKLFSRWKERFFILSRDYLQCFKKGTTRITEMGVFMFKVKLNHIESVELLDRRGYLTLSITVAKEGKMLLRKTEGIREWFQILKSLSLIHI